MAKHYNTVLEVKKVQHYVFSDNYNVAKTIENSRVVTLNGKPITEKQYTNIANEIGSGRLHVYKNVNTTKQVGRNNTSRTVETFRTLIKEVVE